MKLAVLAPPEIPIPLGDNYGGIELIAQDFATALVDLPGSNVVDLYCAMSEDASTTETMLVDKADRLRLLPYPSELSPVKGGYDYTFDFTHQKPFAFNYTKENYMATTFLTDRVSYVNDVFPTSAVKAGFPNVDGTVIYPGIRDAYRYSEEKEDYLLYLGRIAPYKRPDVAIKVGQILEKKVILAGHTGKFAAFPDPGYPSWIRGMADGERVALVENPSLEQKVSLLSKASAVLIPSDWRMLNSQESFGIVAVEALLSGTPVITSGDGGLKEIVTPETGFVCHTLDDYLFAVRNLWRISPRACRGRGLYFTAGRMAQEYLQFARKMTSGV